LMTSQEKLQQLDNIVQEMELDFFFVKKTSFQQNYSKTSKKW